MPDRPLILLPPSEGKTTAGTGGPWSPGASTYDRLDRPRRTVIAALREALRGEPAKLLGVKGDALAAAVAADRAILRSPTLPAIERYSGVLYGELDAASLPAASRRHLGAQVRIFSGMWGVVGALDPIPDYKLKMGATLPRTGKLSTWWRPHLDRALGPDVTGRVVWDLLPNEHSAAWTGGGTDTRRITVRFLDDPAKGRGRELVAVSHWNKLLKGALVRHLLASGLDEPDGLTEFVHPLGYAYRPDLTVHDGSATQVSLVARR
ncbi:MAG TPA: peroxide stress protein YaaA [Microthrixaceae bacterium]|nr:peroxide stress protein YaaA [Microthrixaceae bacterium]